ncbi:MAG: hypothetical protein IMZ66_01330, partial [Planctomycetes bacterium]|nr:hypothetical protein [Planctomycetota bacterium]
GMHGADKVVCVMAAHHFPPLGAIAVIDRRLGLENPAAMTNLTPEIPYTPTAGRNWRDANWGPGDVFFPWSYADPWPLGPDLFLVSYGGPAKGGPHRYRLFLMDGRGRKALLYEDPKTSCFNPVPLRPRPLPQRLPGAPPARPQGEGRFYVLDVYQGLLDKGVERGQIKALRIMSQVPKKFNTEGPRYSDHYPAIGEGTYYVKHNYGTVPVDKSGAAYFVAPAGVELYFQALDAAGKEVRRMGTVTQITDGETQGCIGCHEPRTTVPPRIGGAAQRLRREPDRIAPPPWGAGPVDFVRQVQPVLDAHCVRCHSGRTPKGGVDLSGDKTRLFNMAFETLVFRPGLVERYHLNPGPTGNFPPLATGSYASKLTKLIEAGHEDARVDDEGRRRLYTWIDANVPYYATWDMTRPHTFGGRDTWNRIENGRLEPEPWFRDLADTFKAHCAACHDDLGKHGRMHAWINLTRPEFSRLLNTHLAKEAGGLGLAKEKNGRAPPQFKDEADPVYASMLKAVRAGKTALEARPRVDMAGAVPVPQQRDFGRTF